MYFYLYVTLFVPIVMFSSSFSVSLSIWQMLNDDLSHIYLIWIKYFIKLTNLQCEILLNISDWMTFTVLKAKAKEALLFLLDLIKFTLCKLKWRKKPYDLLKERNIDLETMREISIQMRLVLRIVCWTHQIIYFAVMNTRPIPSCCCIFNL